MIGKHAKVKSLKDVSVKHKVLCVFLIFALLTLMIPSGLRANADNVKNVQQNIQTDEQNYDLSNDKSIDNSINQVNNQKDANANYAIDNEDPGWMPIRATFKFDWEDQFKEQDCLFNIYTSKSTRNKSTGAISLSNEEYVQVKNFDDVELMDSGLAPIKQTPYFPDPYIRFYTTSNVLIYVYYVADPTDENNIIVVNKEISPQNATNTTYEWDHWSVKMGITELAPSKTHNLVAGDYTATCCMKGSDDKYLVFIDLNGGEYYDSWYILNYGIPRGWSFYDQNQRYICKVFDKGTKQETIESEILTDAILSKFSFSTCAKKGLLYNFRELIKPDDYGTLNHNVTYTVSYDTNFYGQVALKSDDESEPKRLESFEISFYDYEDNLIKTIGPKDPEKYPGLFDDTVEDYGQIAYSIINAKDGEKELTPRVVNYNSPLTLPECQSIIYVMYPDNTAVKSDEHVEAFELTLYYNGDPITEPQIQETFAIHVDDGGFFTMDSEGNLIVEQQSGLDTYQLKVKPIFKSESSLFQDNKNWQLYYWRINGQILLEGQKVDVDVETKQYDIEAISYPGENTTIDGDGYISSFTENYNINDGEYEWSIEEENPLLGYCDEPGVLLLDEDLILHYSTTIEGNTVKIDFVPNVSSQDRFIYRWMLNDQEMIPGGMYLSTDYLDKDGKCNIIVETYGKNGVIQPTDEDTIKGFQMVTYFDGQEIDSEIIDKMYKITIPEGTLSVTEDVNLHYIYWDEDYNAELEVYIIPICENDYKAYQWWIDTHNGNSSEIMIPGVPYYVDYEEGTYYTLSIQTWGLGYLDMHSKSKAHDTFEYSYWVYDPEIIVVEDNSESIMGEPIWQNSVVNIDKDGVIDIQFTDSYSEGAFFAAQPNEGYKLTSWTINGKDYEVGKAYDEVITFDKGVTTDIKANYKAIDDDDHDKGDKDKGDKDKGGKHGGDSTIYKASPKTGDISPIAFVILGLIAAAAAVRLRSRIK